MPSMSAINAQVCQRIFTLQSLVCERVIAVIREKRAGTPASSGRGGSSFHATLRTTSVRVGLAIMEDAAWHRR